MSDNTNGKQNEKTIVRKGRVIVGITIERGDGSETSASQALMFDDTREQFPSEQLAEAISDTIAHIDTPRYDEVLAHLVLESEAMDRLPEGADKLAHEAAKIVAFWNKYDNMNDKSLDEKIEILNKYLQGRQDENS